MKRENSGFFDLPQRQRCNDPNHDFPTMLYIPPGKGYRHVCQTCGKQTVVHGQRATLNDLEAE